MGIREKALKAGRIKRLKEEIADIEHQLSQGWLCGVPDCYYPMQIELEELEGHRA
jgi:hypothetical protein